MSSQRTANRTHLIFALCLCVNLFGASSYSLQAPFYPSEAEKKGVPATVYSLVFGCFELVAFTTSPLFGKLVKNTGAKSMLSCGMAINGIMITLFGFLDYCDNKWEFVAFSFVLRMIEALGSTSAIVASYALCGSVFADNVATKTATLDMFYGLGVIIGPTLGGILYRQGGFCLPFVCTGFVCEIIAALIFFFIPQVINLNDAEEEKRGRLTKLLKLPSVLISLSVGFVLAFNLSFYLATLEPYLRTRYGVSTFAISLIIGGTGVVYAVFSPISGKIIDHYITSEWMIVIALLLSVVSGALVGPLPFLPVPKVLTISLVGLYLSQLGMSTGHLAGYLQANQAASEAGFSNSCHGFVYGLYLSALSLGSFVGPTLSGTLFDSVGFAAGTLFLVVINIVLLIVFYFYFLIYQPNRKSHRTNLKDKLFMADVCDLSSMKFSLLDNEANLSIETFNKYGTI